MRRLSRHILLAATLAGGQTAIAQQVGGLAAPCLTPDSVEFVGSTHRAASVLREDAGLPVGQPASSPAIQRAVKNLYATGQFDDVSSDCRVVNGKTIYTFIVKDRPLLSSVDVAGVHKLSPGVGP